jgi:quercetin dioxygenase-like cupin family protein
VITRRFLALAALALTPLAAPAMAGTCPAGQETRNAPHARMTTPSGVTDSIVASIDLAAHPVAIPGRQFRLRRLEVAPGGVVPHHSHADRPAIIHIVSGEIREYSSNCRVPLVHKAGDTVAEEATVSHWWRNEGTVPVVLLSSDLLPSGANSRMM